mmetsp:Transcript_25519/g.76748  ORF Transcript_25519/g.76748 Transcript_25519/m.76748 type:complete len:280 (-) Transcript_25519:631-1470(-)
MLLEFVQHGSGLRLSKLVQQPLPKDDDNGGADGGDRPIPSDLAHVERLGEAAAPQQGFDRRAPAPVPGRLAHLLEHALHELRARRLRARQQGPDRCRCRPELHGLAAQDDLIDVEVDLADQNELAAVRAGVHDEKGLLQAPRRPRAFHGLDGPDLVRVVAGPDAAQHPRVVGPPPPALRRARDHHDVTHHAAGCADVHQTTAGASDADHVPHVDHVAEAFAAVGARRLRDWAAPSLRRCALRGGDTPRRLVDHALPEAHVPALRQHLRQHLAPADDGRR